MVLRNGIEKWHWLFFKNLNIVTIIILELMKQKDFFKRYNIGDIDELIFEKRDKYDDDIEYWYHEKTNRIFCYKNRDWFIQSTVQQKTCENVFNDQNSFFEKYSIGGFDELKPIDIKFEDLQNHLLMCKVDKSEMIFNYTYLSKNYYHEKTDRVYSCSLANINKWYIDLFSETIRAIYLNILSIHEMNLIANRENYRKKYIEEIINFKNNIKWDELTHVSMFNFNRGILSREIIDTVLKKYLYIVPIFGELMDGVEYELYYNTEIKRKQNTSIRDLSSLQDDDVIVPYKTVKNISLNIFDLVYDITYHEPLYIMYTIIENDPLTSANIKYLLVDRYYILNVKIPYTYYNFCVRNKDGTMKKVTDFNFKGVCLQSDMKNKLNIMQFIQYHHSGLKTLYINQMMGFVQT